MPNLDYLYVVLRAWAVAGRVRSYLELSQQYEARTGDWFEPHGSWDRPLGDLNRQLAEAGAPAISALVIVRETGEPGDGFWGCAPNVPPRPRRAEDRAGQWGRIVADVYAYDWPAALP